MLRLRNLDKALKTQLNTTGSFEDKRANKSKREDELKAWLVDLFNKTHYQPRFSLYIIEPKPNSAQRATGVLTVSLELDRYRIEQCISKNRAIHKDHPSSSRYSRADHAALKIPKYSEIGNTIIRLYLNELRSQISGLALLASFSSSWVPVII